MVSPTEASATLLLFSATEAATWLTVTDAVVLAEPLVAVIAAPPFATAVIRPDEDTVAADVFDDAQVTVAPVSV